ncbi:MAG: 2'-5' RNA ligase family protein [Clostridiaceae bacterium]
MKRAIVLFPKCNNIDAIQAIRERFDPLASYIAPHITIVFPFEGELSTAELREHLACVLEGVKKFNVRLNGITGDFRDGYLFLNVKQGNDNIIDLHDRLYSGILEGFLFRKVTYCPHMTVGRVEEKTEFEKALDELGCNVERFETTVDTLYVENIDSSEQSTIEFSYELE